MSVTVFYHSLGQQIEDAHDIIEYFWAIGHFVTNKATSLHALPSNMLDHMETHIASHLRIGVRDKA